MINYIRNLLKGWDKEFEENQKKLAKLKPSLDAIAERKLKKAQDDILKIKEKYLSVFNGEFEVLGIRYIPYCIMSPFACIEVCIDDWDKEETDIFPKIYEYKDQKGNKVLKEMKSYVGETGSFRLMLMSNVNNQMYSNEFVGKQKIDAVVKYLESKK